MTYWRNAGVTYLRYSTIAAQCVRRAIKSDKRVETGKDESTIKRITVAKNNNVK